MAAMLEARVRTAAAADVGLVALLQDGAGPFRWYDTTLAPGSVLPAVVAQVVSNAPAYALAARLTSSFSRLQLTIWGGQWEAGAHAVDDVRNALLSFFDSLNLTAVSRTGQQNNRVVGNRKSVYFQKDTPVHQGIIDVQIYADDAA